ncbi:MAG: tRNA uridine-5-carboxymethylaminomethyl(34) synthesis GTPase MnmE [Treponema sp.]|jgi:tRNA modification GTPase|nr:tRNA uridine-5-carboxymethylaminomethyl(34) synthesis GTPase MnmE [Treponema sp.]
MRKDYEAVGRNAVYGDDSPIAAFATTPGNSAITMIRCSGKGAIEMASSVFEPQKIKDVSGNTVIHGWIVAANEKIDEVLVSVFRGPKSYTGEDSFDICCHGGPSAGRAVLLALKSAGFRDALPGEFTFRAFMNGKIDLTKSESVMELVSAKTETGRRHAVMRLSGSLHAEISDIKKMLVQVLAGAEIYLDYSEDEISADSDDETAGRLPERDIALAALERLKKLYASWQLERLYQEGVTTVIAGRPNAGKSSLFNSLLKEDRSIVTEIPGTTRDWIEAWVSIEGIPVRLVDTAGLRDSSDSVERIGVERSRKLMEEADIVLYLIDGTQGVTNEDMDFIAGYAGVNGMETQSAAQKLLLLWNKADIAPVSAFQPPQGEFAANNLISVSAKTGEGLNDLYTAIGSAISRQTTDLQQSETYAALGTERQKNLTGAACAALEEALALAEKEEPLDLIAPLFRAAVNALGEITGEVSTAGILEEMFSRFCVGK